MFFSHFNGALAGFCSPVTVFLCRLAFVFQVLWHLFKVIQSVFLGK